MTQSLRLEASGLVRPSPHRGGNGTSPTAVFQVLLQSSESWHQEPAFGQKKIQELIGLMWTLFKSDVTRTPL